MQDWVVRLRRHSLWPPSSESQRGRSELVAAAGLVDMVGVVGRKGNDQEVVNPPCAYN